MQEEINLNEEELTVSKDNETPIFDISEDETKLIINFDSVFEKEKLQVYNQFELTAKRNFKLNLNLIKDTYCEIFLDENGNLKDNMQYVLLQILNVQSKIMRSVTMSSDEFIGYIHKIAETADEMLLREINKYVEDGYKLTLDANTKKQKDKNKNSVNEQTMISDEYGKIIIQAAYFERIMIPLISQYFTYNKSLFPTKTSVIQDDDGDDGEDLIFNEVNQTIFNEMLSIVAKENKDNITNKLFKMVYARIKLTTQTSAKFWNIAMTVGITKESAAFDIYSKLLSNSIPKIILAKELNVVSFLSTIIKNQIIFLFSNKFRTHYQTVNPNMSTGSVFESNNDNMTEMEKMEIQLGHKNEGTLIINNVMIKDVVNKIDVYMDVSITKEEVANVLQFVHMNPIQERIIAMLTFKYFNSTEAIKTLDSYEYAKLLICCVKYLEKLKFVLLPKIIMSKCIKQRDRVTITGVKSKAKIEESRRYKDLLNIKFKEFQYDAERVIQSLISTIYSSTFIDTNGNDVFDTTAKIGNVAEEIVDLCYLI